MIQTGCSLQASLLIDLGLENPSTVADVSTSHHSKEYRFHRAVTATPTLQSGDMNRSPRRIHEELPSYQKNHIKVFQCVLRCLYRQIKLHLPQDIPTFKTKKALSKEDREKKKNNSLLHQCTAM